MAKIKTRFLIARQRNKGTTYYWHPGHWPMVALKDGDDPSPKATAIAQADWLNAIYDASKLGDDHFVRELIDEWTAGGSGYRFRKRVPGLSRSPLITYNFPGAQAAHIKKREPRSFVALVENYKGSTAWNELAPRTAHDYALILKDHVSLFGEEPVSLLTKKNRIRETYETLVRIHGLASANARFRVLSCAFRWAIELDWIDANPLTKFKYATTRGRIRTATREEQAHLIETAMRMDRLSIAMVVVLGCFTGQRRADLVKINEATYYDGKFHIMQDKTRARIEFPVSDSARPFLEEARRHIYAKHGDLRKLLSAWKLKNRNADDWRAKLPAPTLIVDDASGLPVTGNWLQHIYFEVRAEAARTMPSVESLRIQDFRDTAITDLVRAGCNPFEMMALSGHKSAQSLDMIRKAYVNIDSEVAQSAVSKLNAYHARRKA